MKRHVANLREWHPQHKSRIQTLLLPFSGWKNRFAAMGCFMWTKGLLRPVLLAWFLLAVWARQLNVPTPSWEGDVQTWTDPVSFTGREYFGVSPLGVPGSLIPGWRGQEAVAAGCSDLLCLPVLSIRTRKGLHPKNHLPFPALGCSP